MVKVKVRSIKRAKQFIQTIERMGGSVNLNPTVSSDIAEYIRCWDYVWFVPVDEHHNYICTDYVDEYRNIPTVSFEEFSQSLKRGSDCLIEIL